MEDHNMVNNAHIQLKAGQQIYLESIRKGNGFARFALDLAKTSMTEAEKNSKIIVPASLLGNLDSVCVEFLKLLNVLDILEGTKNSDQMVLKEVVRSMCDSKQIIVITEKQSLIEDLSLLNNLKCLVHSPIVSACIDEEGHLEITDAKETEATNTVSGLEALISMMSSSTLSPMPTPTNEELECKVPRSSIDLFE